MKSLYFAVLLSTLGTLSLSLLAFIAISDHVQTKHLYPVFEAMDELQLRQAREALETRGRPAVASYMKNLDTLFGVSHYLLDARGVDVVSAEDRAALLPRPPERKSRGYLRGRLIITHQSGDGRYWFVAVNPREPDRWTFFPYYVLVLAVTAVLAWLAAVGVVSPIRRITALLHRFGRGELAARLNTTRQDEIGELAVAFNEMADRLQTLVLSERRLLADISHEMRSPLARLNLAVRLARTAADPQPAFDRVQRHVARITSLVAEIVELARIEGDPLGRRDELIVLPDLIREIVGDAHFEAESRECRINLNGNITSRVSGDRELLTRALDNVLRNAIRYSPRTAAIDLSLAEAGGMATVSIRDYGPGVPEEALARIFDPFFRVDEARDSDSGGVGLGLSIAKRALLLHSGGVTAGNAHPGLRVVLTLPVSLEPELRPRMLAG